MTVTSKLWWSVWWPWAIVWAVAVIAIAVVISELLRDSRARKRAISRVPVVTYYLDDDSIMDLYRQWGYKGAQRREVEEKIRKSIGVKLGGSLSQGNFDADTEVLKKWIEEAEPITVIGTIMGVLAKADVVVNVDLRKPHVVPNKALTDSLAGHGRRRARSVRLSGIEGYVSMTAQFYRAAESDGTTTFVARYGDRQPFPQVRIPCKTPGVRTVATGKSFQGRCLGVVEEWNAEGQELVLRPIAIFQQA